MNPFFSKNEVTAFMQLLVLIAKADGKITKEEIDFLNDYSNNTGLDWKELKEISLEEILSEFKTFSSKIEVMQELVKLAMIDGDYSDEEKAGVKEIAHILSLPESKVIAIEDWVRRGLEWIAEGQALKNEVNL
jgi:tellurite resistance protein